MEWNIEINLRDKHHKIVKQHRCHNVWVNGGRNYLAELLTYALMAPLTTLEERRCLYIGFGIGGDKQSQPAVADNAPLSTDYPGTHIQTDRDLSVTTIERPVRIQAGVYIQQFTSITFDDAYSVRFSTSFGSGDISYGAYLTIPISEVGLFLSDASVPLLNNPLVAYDTFDTVPKTQAFAMDVHWIVRF